MDATYFRMLFEYNKWANARILDRAVEVSEADYFARRSGLSYGNLHGTLLHVVGSDWLWLQRWQGIGADRVPESERPTLASLLELRAENEAAQQSYFEKLTDAELDLTNTYGMPGGRSITSLLGYQIGHWTNHATQYRSEAAVRLTELGLSPGGLDLMVFVTSR